MSRRYDCVVIGSGAAGSAAARACRKEGRRVAVIENRPPGGTCAREGCIPKKVLSEAASVLDSMARWNDRGLRLPPGEADWAGLQRFKEGFTRPVPDRTRRSFEKEDIDLIEGTARFVGPATLQAADGMITADHVVLASGARPAPLSVEGADRLLTSDAFLSLESLPRSMILVGGGFIGFEFAHIAARAGVRVTLLQRGDRFLTGFDPGLVDRLCRRTGDLSVSLHPGHEVKAVERDDQGGTRVITDVDGDRKAFTAEAAFHCAGRVPDLERLELDQAGVAVKEGRPVLNEFLQSTTNPRIYAAGDAAGTEPAVTPAAARQGRLAARNITRGTAVPWDGKGVPSVVFTTPPLARVGLLEAGARERGLRFHAREDDAASWFTSRHVHEPEAAFKILVEDDTDRILGAHLLGPRASEVINLFALAVQNGLTAEQVRSTLFAFPTAGSDVPSMVPPRPDTNVPG